MYRVWFIGKGKSRSRGVDGKWDANAGPDAVTVVDRPRWRIVSVQGARRMCKGGIDVLCKGRWCVVVVRSPHKRLITTALQCKMS
jgi:hypothetical protein